MLTKAQADALEMEVITAWGLNTYAEYDRLLDVAANQMNHRQWDHLKEELARLEKEAQRAALRQKIQDLADRKGS